MVYEKQTVWREFAFVCFIALVRCVHKDLRYENRQVHFKRYYLDSIFFINNARLYFINQKFTAFCFAFRISFFKMPTVF